MIDASHFVQEDAPEAIAAASSVFRIAFRADAGGAG